MLGALDNTAAVQSLPRTNYVDVCVKEDNPWRLLFHTGTGGTTTYYFCAERLNNGASYQFISLSDKVSAVAPVLNDISTIISLMKPSMSQLAAAFRVSRKRIYDWRNGAGMSSANQEQMRALLTAARMLSECGSYPLDQITNRHPSGSESFWSAIASGISPNDAAANVLKIIERDESERSALRRSLASLRTPPVKGDPLFSAHLSE